MAQTRRQIVVIGLGRFGLSVARELSSRGHEVLGVDRVEALVQSAAPSLTHAVVADGSDERTLDQLGVGHFDIGIVALGQEELTSILATMALKTLGVPRVIARSRNTLHGEVLRRIGADQVIYPERDMGYQLAHSFYSPSVIDYIDLGPEVGITKLEVQARSAGRTPNELNLTGGFGLTVVAIQRGQEVLFLPSPDEPLRQGDAVVVMGRDDELDRFLNSRRQAQ